jgi:nucleotide-binding universal stress UspA family protein
MVHKILVALDASDGAWRALEYVADVFAVHPGVRVTLLHVLPGLPPEFWDFRHILTEQERESLKRAKNEWEQAHERQWQELVERARGRLVQAGFPESAVSARFRTDEYKIADAILDEAEEGVVDTIVLGRRGMGAFERLLIGSVSSRVAEAARGYTVTIVE